ncbi:hypothetical protein, partial [Pseudomonas syringae group genomosp. 7]|uniref:hypothetical protein n=1 Tax=Pseudomonas syringae group genomosp. 7 TaxID=251699 RepID=UPI00376F4B30
EQKRTNASYTGIGTDVEDNSITAKKLPEIRMRSMGQGIPRTLHTTVEKWVYQIPFSSLRTSRVIEAWRINGCWNRLSSQCRN